MLRHSCRTLKAIFQNLVRVPVTVLTLIVDPSGRISVGALISTAWFSSHACCCPARNLAMTMRPSGVRGDPEVCRIWQCEEHHLAALLALPPVAGVPPSEGDLAKILSCPSEGSSNSSLHPFSISVFDSGPQSSILRAVLFDSLALSETCLASIVGPSSS